MSLESIFWAALRGSVLCALACGSVHALGGARASLRRLLLVLGLGAAVVSPLASQALLGWAPAQVVAVPEWSQVLASALVDPPAPGELGRSVTEVAARATSRLDWGFWVLGSWASGSLTLLLRLGVGLMRARALARRARLTSPGLAVSDELAGPVVVGLFRPLVILPASSVGWSEERRQLVLLHEHAHVRRRDGLALALGQVACAVYWFQPFAWLGLGRLRRECELSADEDVIASGAAPSSYAEHLVELARAVHEAGSLRLQPGAVAMAAEASELGRRIRALLSRDGLPAPLTRARAFAAWLGAFGSLCAVSSLAAAPEAELARRGGAGGVALAPPDTIDARLQAIAEDEARRARSEWQAERVAVVILEPGTGRLRAMIDPNTPVLLASTLKPLTVALALDRGSITAEQVFDCGGGQRSYGAGSRGPLVLRDVGQHRSLDARRILGVSSNIGVSRIFDRLGGERFARGLSSFHLQAPAHIEDGSFEGAMLAIGARLVATPVALAAAYAVFANDGLYIAPSSTTHPMSSERVISEPTARALRGMLEGAVHDAGASGRLASVPGVRVAGKTGTSDGAEHVVLFAGMLPADAPRFVIVVTVAGAKKRGTGASVAAPLFSRIAGRAIAE